MVSCINALYGLLLFLPHITSWEPCIQTCVNALYGLLSLYGIFHPTKINGFKELFRITIHEPFQENRRESVLFKPSEIRLQAFQMIPSKSEARILSYVYQFPYQQQRPQLLCQPLQYQITFHSPQNYFLFFSSRISGYTLNITFLASNL